VTIVEATALYLNISHPCHVAQRSERCTFACRLAWHRYCGVVAMDIRRDAAQIEQRKRGRAE
jgi:hypothetical protein